MHEAGLSHHESTLNFHVLNMEFLGASEDIAIGHDLTGFKHNYFLGDNPDAWRSGVEPARGLTYEDLYPNTLLDFHTQDGQLKYDWHLSDPQALAAIRWRYNGASSIEVHPEGHLIVHTSVGHFYESNPIRGAGKMANG